MNIDETFELIEEERMIGDQLIKISMYNCRAGCGYKVKNIINEKKKECPGCFHTRSTLNERDKVVTAHYSGGAPARSGKEKGNYKEITPTPEEK